MGSILWLSQIQELFIICAPDTDVIEKTNSYGKCSWTAGHKKKYICLLNFKSFNLVKVH